MFREPSSILPPPLPYVLGYAPITAREHSVPSAVTAEVAPRVGISAPLETDAEERDGASSGDVLESRLPAVDSEGDEAFELAPSDFFKQDQRVVTLPYELEIRSYQKRIWDYMMQNRPGLRAVTVWARRNGKDLIALNILIAKAIQKVGLYLYLGPLHTQTRQIVWLGSTNEGRKFLSYIPRALVKPNGVRNSQMEIDLINGSMIKVVGSDQYDSLMGLNAIGAVFTEYSLQRPEAWQYIRPMMAANGGWALFNGTPRGQNHFYKLAQIAESNPQWFYELLTCEDTGIPSQAAIDEERRAGMSEALIEQEFYCSWTASSESTFIPLDIVVPTVKQSALLDPRLYAHEPRVFGIDVAYAAKGDKAVIAYRQGRKLHFVRWYRGKDNMAFADEIVKFIKLIRPHAVFIDAGRGEGVISRLGQLGYDHLVRGVHFGGKVYEEGIANIKAKLWLGMEEWFLSPNKPDLTGLDESPWANEPVEDQLVNEISMPKKIVDEKKRVTVESKKSLKARGEDSPDLAEAVALTFAEDVEGDEVIASELQDYGVSTELLARLYQKQNEANYNPLDYMNKLMAGGAP